MEAGAPPRFCALGMAGGSFASVDPQPAAARGVAVCSGAAPGPEGVMELPRAAIHPATGLRPVIGQGFALEDAAAAHAIEARATIGKTLLVVRGSR